MLQTTTCAFSFITDTQLGPEVAQQFAERVRRARPSFVLHGGDLVQFGGSAAQWRNLLRALHPFTRTTPLIAAVGNHEYSFDKKGKNLARYLGYAGPEQTWFSHRAGPVEIFVLNSVLVGDDDVNAAQRAWLEGALKRSDATWKIALFHHPVFSRGMMHSGLYPKAGVPRASTRLHAAL